MICSGSLPDGCDINTIAVEISFIYKSLCTEYLSLTSDNSGRVWRVDGATFKKVNHRLGENALTIMIQTADYTKSSSFSWPITSVMTLKLNDLVTR